MTYNISLISENWAQIHGQVNGFAVRHFDGYRHYWLVSFYSFLNNHVQLKASTNDKERTLSSLETVKQWIDKVITKENATLTETT